MQLLAVLITFCLALVWGFPAAVRESFPVRKYTSNARIIGGSRATNGQFPWQVAIFFDTDGGSFFCSGALIDRKWVLTSGHCVYGATSFFLLLGTTRLDVGGIETEPTYSVSHPQYNPETFENDLGLIRIDDSITIDENTQTISVASNELQSETSVTVSGWGGTSGESGAVINDLNFVNLKTITNNECKFSYGMIVPDEIVCAMGNRNNGICTGDSGDPLVVLDFSGKAVLVGTASWSSASGCQSSQPSGFTRTSSYHDWISNVISNN